MHFKRFASVLRHGAVAGAMIVAAGLQATPALALTQSWNGYRWARTGPLVINVGNNLSSNWRSMMAPATTAWSAASMIDMRPVTGTTTNGSCAARFGSVQVCNGNYGANGWLGYANVWLSGSFIVQATVRLNDYYFSMAKYNTSAWRQMTMCQEIGHTLGLDHTNTIKTNLNTGSCMDYTNDPSGTKGTNGTRANLAPNSTDFSALNGIYATLNSTQLASTKPQYIAGEGFSVDGHDHDSFMAVPEPGSWMLLLGGFGLVGAGMRGNRKRTRVMAIAG